MTTSLMIVVWILLIGLEGTMNILQVERPRSVPIFCVLHKVIEHCEQSILFSYMLNINFI